MTEYIVIDNKIELAEALKIVYPNFSGNAPVEPPLDDISMTIHICIYVERGRECEATNDKRLVRGVAQTGR